MLDTGFEFLQVVNIVFCQPTRSETLNKQIRGRGMRLCDGKEFFVVLDSVGKSEYFDEKYEVKRKRSSLHPDHE